MLLQAVKQNCDNTQCSVGLSLVSDLGTLVSWLEYVLILV